MQSRGIVEAITPISGKNDAGYVWNAKDITISGTKCRFFTTPKIPVDCAVGDTVEFETKQKPNSQYWGYSNLKVVVDLEQHTPLPAGFTTTPSPQSTIVKQVEAELLAEGKATIVYPAPKPKEKFVRGHWELFNEEALRAELARAREAGADGVVEGQLINLIRYEEISEKLTALIDVTSKLYNKLGESR